MDGGKCCRLQCHSACSVDGSHQIVAKFRDHVGENRVCAEDEQNFVDDWMRTEISGVFIIYFAEPETTLVDDIYGCSKQEET